MNTPEGTPRWGAEKRDQKAEAIWKTLQASELLPRSSSDWLDVGCGSGGIASALAVRVERMLGVDPEPWPQWVSLCERHNNLTFKAGHFDRLHIEVPTACADVIICNQVYEHVRDPAQLISNLYRTLRPGGVVYFAGPNLLWPIEPHVHWPFVHWLPRHIALSVMTALGSSRTRDLDATSTYWLRLERWFKTTGFEVTNGIGLRAKNCDTSSIAGQLLGLMARLVPGFIWNLTRPVAPGFVYILKKKCPTDSR